MKTNQVNPKRSLTSIAVMFLLAVSMVTVGCSNDDDDMVVSEPVGDIVALLDQITENPESYTADILKSKSINEKKPKFTHLRQALVKTGLVSTVAKTELTVFAPTDAAFENLFAALGVNGIDDLTAEQLTPILLYHVVAGKVKSTDLTDGYVAMLNEAAVKVDLSSGVMINDAMVTIADVHAANGVIHIIDKVLLPPSKNLVETALSFAPEFSILVDAVIKANLAETLATGGPFTVFAPTNDAFVALLGELGANSLDDIDVTTLTNVLLYHVVQGRVYSSDLSSGPVTTLNGTFDLDVSTLKITDANARMSGLIPSLLNVQATNGVIHVIDRVILP